MQTFKIYETLTENTHNHNWSFYYNIKKSKYNIQIDYYKQTKFSLYLISLYLHYVDHNNLRMSILISIDEVRDPCLLGC